MIIGLIGFAGAGKDTVAEYLVSKGFHPDAYAATVKDAVAVVFGWDRGMLEGRTNESREWREMPDKFWSDALGYEFTPRMALQRMGTEAGQGTFGKKLWVASLMKRVEGYPKVVITDARFSHEVSSIKDAGGILIRIKRGEDPEWVEILKHIYTEKDREWYMKRYPIHKSEWDWIGYGYDYLINNDSDLPALYGQVDAILEREIL